MHPHCYPGQDHLSAQTVAGCDFFQSLDTVSSDFAPPIHQSLHVHQRDEDGGQDRGQMLPPMSSFSQSFPSPGDYHPKYHSFNESPDNDENGIDFNQILGMGCESVAEEESQQSHQQHQQQQQHDYEMQSLGPPALLYSGFEHESFGTEMQFEPANAMSHEYLTTDSHVAGANSFYTQSFLLATGGNDYSGASSHSIHTMSSDTSHMSQAADQQKSSQSVSVAEQHIAGYAFQSATDTLPQTVHQSHHSAGAHPASRSAFSQQHFSSTDFLSFEDTETSESLIDLHSTLVDLLPPTPQPTAPHTSRPDDQTPVQLTHSQSFAPAGAFSFLGKESAAPHVDLVNDSLVLRVECFKCKVCRFLSEDRAQVLMHISEKHESQRQAHHQLQHASSSEQINSPCNKSFAGVDEFSKHMDTQHQITSSPSSQGLGHESQAAPAAMRTTEQSIAAVSPMTQSTSPSHARPLPAESTTLVQSSPDDAQQVSTSETESKKKNSKANNNKEKKVKVVKKASSKKVAWNLKLNRELGTFICPKVKCSFRFASMEKMLLHEKCHRDDGVGFACCECDKFRSNHWNSTTSHLWNKHAIDMELYRCDKCNYRSYSISVLENIHKKTHSPDKNYPCTTCGKRFKNHKQLMNHRKRHEKSGQQAEEVMLAPVPEPVEPMLHKPAAHVCDACGKVFPEARPLRLHQDQVHKKKRPYVCQQCNHCAASKGALRVHIRSHTGEKPFKCDDCEYSTSDHNSLRRHKMRHSGERPYKCPFCDYACIQSSTYKQHLRNKHPDQSAGVVFSCSMCGFKSVNEEIFRAHTTEHQNLGPSARLKHPVSRQHRRFRSDGESSSSSSSSLSPPPLSSSPESPIMHLARGIVGSSKPDTEATLEPELAVAEVETETSPQLTLVTSKSALPNPAHNRNTSDTNL